MIKFIYIDLFCGAGGTSTGVELARYNGEKCAKVIACVNHDRNAIASHAANHPDALHFTEDIRTLELSPLVEHINKMKKEYPDALVVLWASLECTNFSKAKGGKPRDADSRTLAEHLYRYIVAINPDYIQVENVEEFMSWGQLDENGKPISKKKGLQYIKWVDRVKYQYGIGADKISPDDYEEWYDFNREYHRVNKEGGIGKKYEYDYRILNAADYGAYTSRKRFFGIFAKIGLPIVFPKKTHDKNPDKYKVDHNINFPYSDYPDFFNLDKTLEKWKPVREVLDFLDEGESIFTRKKPLSDRTLERIYAGLIKFVAGGKDKFLSAYYGVGKTNFKDRIKTTALSINQPCGVITTNNRFSVVQTKFISKYYSGHPDSKNKSINEPADTVTAIDHHSLVQAKFLMRYNGQPNQYINAVSVESPAPTLTTVDRLAIVTNCFLNMQYGNGTPSSCDVPAPTATTNPKHNLVVCKRWIMNTNYSNTGSSIDEPSQTITANRKWHYLMNPQFCSAGGDVEKPCFTLIARMDKMPPYLVVTETGQMFIEIYETDNEPMLRIKEFMALYGIADIKMRMLKIPELKQIMGFSKDYTLIGTQAEQKKYIGNAVEVNMSRVWCEALVMELFNFKTKYL